MANPTFLFMNPATTVFTGSGAGFANLNDYEPETTWSSGGTTEFLGVIADLGVAKNITHVALAGHNGSTLGDVILVVDAANNAAMTDPTILRQVILPASIPDPCLLTMNTATGSFRYVRVYSWFNTTGSQDEPLRLGSFWAGDGLVLDTPFDVPARTENAEYQTFEGVSLNGNLRSSQVYSGGRIVNEIRFSIQSDATANLIRSFVQTVKGRRYPYYFAEDCETTGSVRLMHFVDDYVPVETIGYNRNTVAMKMRTHHSSF